MDRIREQQNIVSGRKRVANEVPLDHIDPDPLGLACEPAPRYLASTRQFEQGAAQRWVPSEGGEQDGTRTASNIEQPPMPRKVVIGRQRPCRRRGKGFDSSRENLLFLGTKLTELRPAPALTASSRASQAG
ncbi:MAG TPA: hypothetical protein VMF86_08940 [Stellaceae bacterium]|nr:hypothetical protein [Stellaceae bacterium]